MKNMHANDMAENSSVNITSYNRYNALNSCISAKIRGGFNKIEYCIKEQSVPFCFTKKYFGNINNQSAEYIVNPEQGKLHKGKIQGYIGDNKVNLIVISDLFGRKTILGLYKNEQVKLTIYKDFFSIHIDGKNTNVIIKRNFLALDRLLEGNFEYGDELMPLIISYIKLADDIKNEKAA